MSTIADASSGSRNPAARPTATQLRFQNVSRCPAADHDLANGQVPARGAEIVTQFPLRLLVRYVAARVHVTDTASRRQADVPDPAGGLRGGNRLACNRSRFARVRHLHRQRTIAEQHVAALLERHAERLTDQQRLEARAIDEQVALDFARLRRAEAANVAVPVRDSRAARPRARDARPAFRSNAPAGRPRICRRRDDRSSWRRPRTRRSRWSWARVRRHRCGPGGIRHRRSCARPLARASAAPGSAAQSSAEASAGDSRSRPRRRSSSARTAHPV